MEFLRLRDLKGSKVTQHSALFLYKIGEASQCIHVESLEALALFLVILHLRGVLTGDPHEPGHARWMSFPPVSLRVWFPLQLTHWGADSGTVGFYCFTQVVFSVAAIPIAAYKSDDVGVGSCHPRAIHSAWMIKQDQTGHTVCADFGAFTMISLG